MLNDQPIKNSKEDLLNRATFAEDFADTILSYTSDNNCVISINGEWGVGKTSLINMIKENLNSKIKNKLSYANRNNIFSSEFMFYQIIDFTPWNALNENGIINQFFNVLKANFNEEKVRQILKSCPYKAISSALKSIPKIGKIFKGIDNLLNNYCNSFLNGSENLDEIKEIICSKLSKSKWKFILFIDDIDRLNNSEIRLLMQLIKAVCNFPNVIYVLAYDKKIVANALSDEQLHDSGYEYLEKIIHFSIDVPKIRETDIQKYLFGNLNEIISENKIEFDNDKFSDIYYNFLSKYLKTLRSVNKFVNSICFKIKKYLKVLDFIDFLTVEAISLFEPELLSLIYENKNLLCGSLINEKDEINIFKQKVDCVSKNYQLVVFLFPKIDNNKYSIDYNSDKLYGRFYLLENFEFYFNGILNEKYISKDYFNSLLTLDLEQFKKNIKLMSNYHFYEFLRFLYAYSCENMIDNKFMVFIKALIEREYYVKEIKKMYGYTNDTLLSLIIEKKLISLINAKEKNTFLEELYNSTSNIRFLLNFFFHLAKKTDFYHKNDNIDEKVIPKNEINVLYDFLVEKIRNIIFKKENLESSDLRFYFYFLYDKNKDIIEEWFKLMSIDDIINIVRGFYVTAICSINGYMYIGYRSELNVYKEFFDDKTIKAKLKEKLIGTGVDAEIGEVLYLMPDIPNDEHYSFKKIKEFADKNSIIFSKKEELVDE